MLRKLLLASLLALSLNAQAGPWNDTSSQGWTGVDKAAHASVEFVLGTTASVMLPEDNKTKAFALAFSVGLAKEAYDTRKGGSGWSNKDLVADAVGAYLGVQIGHKLRVYATKRGNCTGVMLEGNLN